MSRPGSFRSRDFFAWPKHFVANAAVLTFIDPPSYGAHFSLLRWCRFLRDSMHSGVRTVNLYINQLQKKADFKEAIYAGDIFLNTELRAAKALCAFAQAFGVEEKSDLSLRGSASQIRMSLDTLA